MGPEVRGFSKGLSPAWCAAQRELIENVKREGFLPRCELAVHACVDGKKVYLPAYIPYIGREYFEYKPRILCYAINQNLSRHVRWTKDWVSRWGTDEELALDRLNRAAQEGLAIPIRPYAEGFIPLVGLMGLRRRVQVEGGVLPEKIDDVIAVTNFVKFSTDSDASSSSIPGSWWRECAGRFVAYEIEVLKPDIIICFGQKTLSELRRVVGEDKRGGCEPEILGCRFPARIASVKSRPLSRKEERIWTREIAPLIERMRKPRKKSYHKWKIQQYPGYFIDVLASWG